MSGDLGRLVLQFAADVAGFQSDLGRVERAAARSARETARSFDSAVTGLTSSIKSAAIQMGAALAAAFTVNALKDFVKSGIDVADTIDEVAGKVGVTTEALSGLKYAVEQNDSDFETLSKGLIKLEQNAVKSLETNSQLGRTFAALGVNVLDSAGKVKSGEVLFSELADTLGQVQDISVRNKIGLELFGKSFTGLIPTLTGGSEGIAAFAKEAARLGIIVDAQTGKFAGAFNDALVKIEQAMQGAALVLAKELLPSLIEVSQQVTEFIIAAKDSGGLKEFGETLSSITKALVRVAELASDAGKAIKKFILESIALAPLREAVGLFQRLAEAAERVRGINKVGAPDAGGAGKADKGLAFKADAATVKTARDLSDALRNVGGNAAIAAPKVREFVAAVRVLSIDKAILTTPKDLAASIQKIREELDPTIAVYAKYEQAVIDLNKQSEIEVNLKKRNDDLIKQLTANRDRELAVIKETEAANGGVIDSLIRETAALKGSAFDREESAKAIRIEAAYRDALIKKIQETGEATDDEKKQIRELVTERDNLVNKKTFNFGGALSDAINEGFAKGSLTAGFKNLIKQLKDAFSSGPEGIAGAIASIANGLNSIITAAQNSDGNSTGAGIRAGVDLLAQSGNAFAQAAQAIDVLFKGKLFGTDFARQSQSTNATFGAGGFGATSTAVDTRQRSFFRGTQTRTTTTAADAATIEAGAAFQRALDDISRTISEAFGSDLSARVNASFVQNFDKNGLVSTIATVGGRVVAAGTQQAFEQYLTAQTIIDALKPSIQGLDALADPFRNTGESILEFARFALAAQTDIAQGAALLGEGSKFAELIPVISSLSKGGESLSDTYRRVSDSFKLMDSALKTIGGTTQLTRLEFVKFGADLVAALGGIKDASEIIGRNLAEFFSPEELRATRLTNAQSTLTGLGKTSGLGLLSDADFKVLLKQALAGAFDAERTAEILAYGDALATVNGLMRETAAANDEAATKERDRIRAIKEAGANLTDFITGLQDSAADGSLTDYQRKIKELNKQYAANATQLNDLARQAGLTAAPIEGVTANLSILAQGAARALGDLKITVLKGLDSLFSADLTDQERASNAFNELVYGNARATNNWAEQLKELETLQETQDLARNIADLFSASGLSFAQGVEQYGVPLRGLLDNLGVDFANLTDPASIAAFGAAAGLLGVSAEELAKITGIDLSGLSEAQRTALDIASKPQVKAAESSANSLLSIDEKSTSIITVLMQQKAATIEQSEALQRMSANFNSLSDSVTRLANRVPAA